jgi:hypothetical protein
MTDLIEITPTFEQYAFTLGGVAPMRNVAPGSVLRLWSDDALVSRVSDRVLGCGISCRLAWQLRRCGG